MVLIVGRRFLNEFIFGRWIFLLKMMFGEMSDLVLKGRRAETKKLSATGFKYRFPTLSEALSDIYKKLLKQKLL